ncbi:hypothetical protein MJH12_10275 [bacterium]|nr:hypothetical protein [bacterium]
MLLEQIELIKNFWDAHEVNYAINEELKEQECIFDLDELNIIYKDIVTDLVEKDGRIDRKSLSKLRSFQQEYILVKESSNQLIRDHLKELQRIGKLVLELF